MRKNARKYLRLTELLWRRFKLSERGATAIEFAIIGPVFFALVGATMETAVIYFAGQTLDSGVQESSRLIRTGQAGGMSPDEFRGELCGRLYGMFDCEKIHLTIAPLDAFGDYEPADPTAPESPPDFGARSDVMVYEAHYLWPAILNIPGLMTGVEDGGRRLSATRVFRNEPFD